MLETAEVTMDHNAYEQTHELTRAELSSHLLSGQVDIVVT